MAVLLAGSLLASGSALAQTDVACHQCLDDGQSARWEALGDEHSASASRLKKARDLLRRAEERGDQELVSRVRPALEQARARWEYIDAQMQAMESDSYRDHLLRRANDAAERLAAARMELQETTRRFDRFRNVQGLGRDAVLRDMLAIAEHEKRQRFNLGFNSILAGIGGVAKNAPKALAWIRESGVGGKLPKPALDFLLRHGVALEKRTIDTLELVDKAATYGKVDYDIAVEDYSGAVIGVLQIVTDHVAEIAAGQSVQAAGAMPAIAGMSLDLVLIAQSHKQYRDAEGRLDENLSVESRLREDFMADAKILAENIRDLRRTSSRAAEGLSLQESYVASAAEVRRGLEQ